MRDWLRQLRFEQRALLLIVAAAAPGLVLAGGILWIGAHAYPWAWIFLGVISAGVAAASVALFRTVVRPLQTISNLLAALREEDFSTRASGARAGDALGEVYLEGDPSRTVQASFPSGVGRWSIRRSTFRQAGRTCQLLVIADLSRALREEERLAWQRLIRVLGHEINNSLAPIKSISDTLASLVNRSALPTDLRDDMGRGLGVIGSRADNLGRFMATYTQLARLPTPTQL